jgi:hypothetical protein
MAYALLGKRHSLGRRRLPLQVHRMVGAYSVHPVGQTPSVEQTPSTPTVLG